jgi:choline dehydrogenase-like flavoprotein
VEFIQSCIGRRKVAQRPEVEIESALAAESGIYHRGGSARMGSSAASGMVDRDLRVFGLGDVSVVSTSVFRRGAPRMLALRLLDQFSDEIRQ